MYTDATIQAFDNQIKTINDAITYQQSLKSAYAQRIDLAKKMETALRNGDNSGQVSYYNALQAWTEKWLGIKNPLKTQGSGVSESDANQWNSLWNSWISSDIPAIDAQILTLNGNLQTVIDNKNNYYNNLPANLKESISNQEELNKLQGMADVEKAKADAIKAKAESDAALLKLQMEQQDSAYAQSKSKVITYAGIAIGVVFLLGLAYIAFFSKTKPKAE